MYTHISKTKKRSLHEANDIIILSYNFCENSCKLLYTYIILIVVWIPHSVLIYPDKLITNVVFSMELFNSRININITFNQ